VLDHKHCHVRSSRPSGQPQRRLDDQTWKAGGEVQTAGGNWQTRSMLWVSATFHTVQTAVKINYVQSKH